MVLVVPIAVGFGGSGCRRFADRVVAILVLSVTRALCSHALAPEMQPDGAGYHLGLPAMWLRDGGFTGSIGFFELLPLGVETLYGAAMAVGGPSAAKLVHLTFLILTIPLVIQIARGLGLSEGVGWAGALLYCLAPVAGISGTSAYSDAALVLAHVALFVLSLEWKDTPSARSRSMPD